MIEPNEATARNFADVLATMPPDDIDRMLEQSLAEIERHLAECGLCPCRRAEFLAMFARIVADRLHDIRTTRTLH